MRHCRGRKEVGSSQATLVRSPGTRRCTLRGIKMTIPPSFRPVGENYPFRLKREDYVIGMISFFYFWPKGGGRRRPGVERGRECFFGNDLTGGAMAGFTSTTHTRPVSPRSICCFLAPFSTVTFASLLLQTIDSGIASPRAQQRSMHLGQHQ